MRPLRLDPGGHLHALLLAIVVAGHACDFLRLPVEHAADADPLHAEAVDDERGIAGVLGCLRRLGEALGPEGRVHHVRVELELVFQVQRAAALGVEHGDLAVRAGNAAREPEGRECLAAVGPARERHEDASALGEAGCGGEGEGHGAISESCLLTRGGSQGARISSGSMPMLRSASSLSSRASHWDSAKAGYSAVTMRLG